MGQWGIARGGDEVGGARGSGGGERMGWDWELYFTLEGGAWALY